MQTASDLPPPGPIDAVSRERHDLDFKEAADPQRTLEHAKDVAAFANTLGGVILVGATLDNGVVSYPGVSMTNPNPKLCQQPDRVVESFEQAAKNHCAPRPSIDAVVITRSNGTKIVAVNVDPFIDHPIACKAYVTNKQTNQLEVVDGGWRFPYRVASLTEFLTPTELPMYMDPQVRRAIVLLERVSREMRLKLVVHASARREVDGRIWDGVYQTSSLECSLRAVNQNENFVNFGIKNAHVHVPLRDVRDVWKDGEGLWHVVLVGCIQKSGDTHEYQPRL